MINENRYQTRGELLSESQEKIVGETHLTENFYQAISFQGAIKPGI
jgi:hypothetical protein